MISIVLFSRPTSPVYQDSDEEPGTSSVKRTFAAPPGVHFPGKVVTLSSVTSVLQ